MGFFDYTTVCKHDLNDCENRLSSGYTKQSDTIQSYLVERLDKLESCLKRRFDEIDARLSHIETRLEDMEDRLEARK